jgi:outer membrane immunogenic protein
MMKNLICSLAAVGAGLFVPAVVSRPAAAADLPVAPSYAPPGYVWDGFYLGAHVGGATDHRDATIFSIATGASLVSGSTNASGVIGGGQIGFNYTFAPDWVLGIEADVSGSDLHSTAIGAPAFGQRDNDINAFGTVRGRLGYASNSWLFYGTGGFAWADESLTRTQLVGAINGASPGTVEKASAFGTGWAAGVGIEWGFAPNWSARAEYLHLDFGTDSFSFPLAGQRVDANATIDAGRFGVNYKFD